MDKLERMMATISPIGGIGLGLWFGSVYSGRYTTVLGIGLVFISAVLLSILSYLRKKKLENQNE